MPRLFTAIDLRLARPGAASSSGARVASGRLLRELNSPKAAVSIPKQCEAAVRQRPFSFPPLGWDNRPEAFRGAQTLLLGDVGCASRNFCLVMCLSRYSQSPSLLVDTLLVRGGCLDPLRGGRDHGNSHFSDRLNLDAAPVCADTSRPGLCQRG